MKKDLGLKRNTVSLKSYDPTWPSLFEQERRTIGNSLSPASYRSIEHVGSTAVPGLSAKPIIDIAIAIDSLSSLEKIRRSLERIGYEYRGDGGTDGGHVFVKSPGLEIRTFHLHVVWIDDPQWDNYIRFRDALRQNPKLAGEYAKIKMKLAEDFPEDRKKYTHAKDNFIQKILN